MINNKKVTIVLPAYNAEKTLEITYNEIPFDIVDEVILVDDKSNDKTVEKGRNSVSSILLCMNKTKAMEVTRNRAIIKPWS
jgi:glycosyltransferase involved in cell wall biosynthesis